MSTTQALRGTIEHLDPASLVIEDNVRPSTPVTKEFVQSIQHNGVLTPVLARRSPDGTVIVRAGQRRTLAAREAGSPTIPVYVVEADETTAERIIQQMVENDQREALTDADRAAAFRQLTFEGLGIATIAKRTGTKPQTVKTGLVVADNETAATALAEHQLTLDQAAVLIDFEDDPDTRATLIQVATTDPAQFAHAAQRARDDRIRHQARTAAEADLAALGYTVLDRDWFYNGEYTRITDLRIPAGDPVTAADIADVDGRAAYVQVGFDGIAETIYFLADPKAAGFKKATGAGAANGPMSDEQKAERRTLIANNKAWASAETVRREWLTTLLSRNTLPKDIIAWIAHALVHHRWAVGAAITGGNQLAHQLLGVERSVPYSGTDNLADFLIERPTKASHVTLAIILGGIEAATSRDTWRRPSHLDADYFAQLAEWGYTLSDVEKTVAQRVDTVGV